MRRTFSIVVPVFQNESNLHDTVPKLLSLQNDLPNYALELVFVDDGSSDRSLEILVKYAESYPGNIKIVKLTRNFGQTPAVQAGLRHANGSCVGIISADLQEPHELFVDMVKEWEGGARFVIGERQAREEGWLHQTISGIYWNLVRRFAFPEFPRLGYDFCLLDRQVVDDINRINEKNTSIFVLVYWLGYRPIRLPIIRRQREKGNSQWRVWKKVSFTVDTLVGFTYLPARVITLMGFTIALLCVVYLVAALGQWFWLRAAPPGWMTVVGLTTLLGAMILFSLGIVSEYVLRILDEARKRPPYVIERVIGKTDAKK
ncbi:glycosyltransferase family 2 protein [Nitrospiraceae bacterium AH_259_D15_M11_P09]|nr:glycosyltransferase family 2 protein [Nitrospiraceae bacterium AH_259_D15_M11_P09]